MTTTPRRLADARAAEANKLLEELQTKEDVSSCEADGFDMPESGRHHSQRLFLLKDARAELTRARAAELYERARADSLAVAARSAIAGHLHSPACVACALLVDLLARDAPADEGTWSRVIVREVGALEQAISRVDCSKWKCGRERWILAPELPAERAAVRAWIANLTRAGQSPPFIEYLSPASTPLQLQAMTALGASQYGPGDNDLLGWDERGWLTILPERMVDYFAHRLRKKGWAVAEQISPSGEPRLLMLAAPAEG